jgi:hypothetical protein
VPEIVRACPPSRAAQARRAGLSALALWNFASGEPAEGRIPQGKSAVDKTTRESGFEDLHHFPGVFNPRDAFSAVLYAIQEMVNLNFERFVEINFG